jgi:hypothetical protein
MLAVGCNPVPMRKRRIIVYRAYLPVKVAMEESVKADFLDNGRAGTRR